MSLSAESKRLVSEIRDKLSGLNSRPNFLPISKFSDIYSEYPNNLLEFYHAVYEEYGDKSLIVMFALGGEQSVRLFAHTIFQNLAQSNEQIFQLKRAWAETSVTIPYQAEMALRVLADEENQDNFPEAQSPEDVSNFTEANVQATAQIT